MNPWTIKLRTNILEEEVGCSATESLVRSEKVEVSDNTCEYLTYSFSSEEKNKNRLSNGVGMHLNLAVKFGAYAFANSLRIIAGLLT